MLSFVLLYFLGKYFYDLSIEYDKNKGLYTFLGVSISFIGYFVFGIIATLIIELASPGFIDGVSDRALGYMMLPFGILSAYLYYKFLKKRWSIKTKKTDFDVLDDVFLNKD